MKITTIAALIATCALTSSAAYANSDVTFIGAVTAQTCEVLPEIDGAVKNTLQLGSVAPSEQGTAVPFTLKAASSVGCDALTADMTASIAWTGPFDATGLKAANGSTAIDSHVLLSTVNASTTPVVAMKEGATTANFVANLASTDGFKYTAVLDAGATPGNFATAAAYTVAYM
jgi:type 1 fimbria pilin